MHWGRRLQLAAVICFVVAYAVLSHYSNSVPGAHRLGAVLSLAPLLVVGFLLAWRSVGLPIAILLAAAAALLLYLEWPIFERNFSRLFLLQECGFYTLMAATFALSLRRGAIALCTAFADRVHGPLTPREVRYTRRVTVAWALFFASLAATTFGLFLWAPLRVWSLFANFCVLPLVGLMFVAEYTVRRRVLPPIQRGSIIASVRVYFAGSR